MDRILTNTIFYYITTTLACKMIFEFTIASRVQYQIVLEEIGVHEERVEDLDLRWRNNGSFWNT